ncbi:MAG: DUF3298 and DUF4163 domain-containing protein [Cyclobacteriaceae bacterium]|nr:DUF3298 and DUF4163 domain-containing protein [Cyclobacteriaceae bacterium]MCK5209173.1 DUF3298 and DUF4163 domain-containing protein [Cyclobacteriaceae bacterium]
MKKFQLIYFFLVIMVISCFEKNYSENPGESLPSIVVKELIKSSQNCNPDSGNCTYVKIEYPEFTDSARYKLNAFIYQKIRVIVSEYISEETENGTLEHIAQTFIHDYEAFKIDFPKYNFGWYVMVKAEIIYETDNIISLSMYREAFTGGAHPNSGTSFFVIDVLTNKELAITDIVSDTTQFKKLLENEFWKVKGMDENQSFADVGYYLNEGDFLLNNNIGLTDESVIVHFNPYEIAPYSEGATTLKLSREKLAGILKVK